MSMPLKRWFALILSVTVWVGEAQAEDTDVMVRLRATDAKFVGSGVGGVNVVVEATQTGEILDSGRITGGTGDTGALMKAGQTRGRSPVTADTAGFEAELDIAHPTRVRVRLQGPLEVRSSIQQASVTTWVVPGEDIEKPGIVLNRPGLIVEVVERSLAEATVTVVAGVTLMCGCPITDGGLWDADDYEVVGQLRRDGEVVAEEELAFTGEASRFAGELEAPDDGDYRLTVYAISDAAANTGVFRETLTVH